MEDNTTSAALEEQVRQLVIEIDAIVDRAKAEKRDLSRSEAKSIDRKTEVVDQVSALLERRRFAESTGAPAIACPPTEPRGIFPVARGSVQSEMTYRPDRAEVSFIRDLVNASHDDEARERLRVNRAEATFAHGWDEREAAEYRDMSNTTSAGSEFVPPL